MQRRFLEGGHKGRPHVFEGIGCNAVGAGLVPAPNATPCNVVTALSMEALHNHMATTRIWSLEA